MSYVSVYINNIDVTQYVTKIGYLREWNDEGTFFAGVFRRANLEIELDNTNNIFNRNGKIFSGSRNDKPVELIYNNSNPRLNPYRVFSGVITEGSTRNNLENKTITLVILDYLKLIDGKVIKTGNQSAIDSLYRNLRGGASKLNKHFIACYLFYFLRQDNFKLNKVFNVFKNNELKADSYPNINVSIESLFPPSDNYYGFNNISALSILSNLCQSTNSYLYVETLEDKTELFIKARPNVNQSQKIVRESNILSFSAQTDGFNKLYNSITINGSRAYIRQNSIDKYGVRALNISSYAPASSALADTYLDYYSEPKPEVTFNVKMNNDMLDIKIGDMIKVDLKSRPDLTIQGLKGVYFVLGRKIHFDTETMLLRLRGI